MIGFEKTGQDAVTGKITWRLVDVDASDDSSYITGIELFVDGGIAQI